MKIWKTHVYPITINLCINWLWRTLEIIKNGVPNPNVIDDIISLIYYPFIYFTVRYFGDINDKKERK